MVYVGYKSLLWGRSESVRPPARMARRVLFSPEKAVWSSLLGGYPKNSDNYPNTSGDLNTSEYTVRAQRDSDALRK
jgi:hypothetical protein